MSISTSSWVAAVVLLLLTACAAPSSHVSTVDRQPGLMVTGAPRGAILVVDGIEVGPANDYSKIRTLSVLPGRHVVEVRGPGDAIHREEIFVDGGAVKTIHVQAE